MHLGAGVAACQPRAEATGLAEHVLYVRHAKVLVFLQASQYLGLANTDHLAQDVMADSLQVIVRYWPVTVQLLQLTQLSFQRVDRKGVRDSDTS